MFQLVFRYYQITLCSFATPGGTTNNYVQHSLPFYILTKIKRKVTYSFRMMDDLFGNNCINIFQVTTVTIVIKSVTHYKFIRNLHGYIIYLYVTLQGIRLL